MKIMNSLQKPPIRELIHYGVQGMKWGIRKDDIILPKGTKIVRLTNTLNEIHKGYAYASFTREDIDSYVARLQSKYKVSYKVKDVLISPSEKTRVEEFVKVFKEDPNIGKEMEKFRQFALDYAKKTGMPKEQVYAPLYTKIMIDMSQSKLEDVGYKVFQASMFNSKYNRDAFIDRLSKQGYNMVIDDNDRLKTKFADMPLLIFDRGNSLDVVKTEKVSPWEINTAAMRAYQRGGR